MGTVDVVGGSAAPSAHLHCGALSQGVMRTVPMAEWHWGHIQCLVRSLLGTWGPPAVLLPLSPYSGHCGDGPLLPGTRGTNMSKKSNIQLPRDVTATQLADLTEPHLRDDRDSGPSRQPRHPRWRGDGRVTRHVATKPKKTIPKEVTPGTSQGHVHPDRKEKRTHLRGILLPPPGQPGGRNDPLRIGLSGAGFKWYLRFLSQGMTPEEARKKAGEKKAEPQSTTSQKRGTAEITPPQRGHALKKRKVVASSTHTATASGPRTTYAETTKVIKVAIIPKQYPETTLSTEELTKVEDAVVNEIAMGGPCKVQFGGIHFRPGHVIVDCINQETVEWLMEKTPMLCTWKGSELRACLGDDIPRAHNITVFFPRSTGRDNDFLLSLVSSQNIGLNTSLWRILRSKDEGTGRLLSIGIDEESCESIKKNGHALFYRFGKIPVQGLEKPSRGDEKEEEEGVHTAQEEGMPTEPPETIVMAEEDRSRELSGEYLQGDNLEPPTLLHPETPGDPATIMEAEEDALLEEEGASTPPNQ